MNFGESLAYWYFRLNGFFPLNNFVLHRQGLGSEQNADADLLAIRFPHVHESIGGLKDDWDNEVFTHFGFQHESQIVCVIAEIKTGRHDADDLSRAFEENRLRYALRRFGVLQESDCEIVLQQLNQNSVVSHDRFTFAKVWMSNARTFRSTGNNRHQCCAIELSHVVQFIRNRMKKYRSEKHASRMFFPGDLIQFFAWREGLDISNPLDFGER